MPSFVAIEVPAMDYAHHRGDYDRAVEAVEGLGYEVRLEFGDGERDLVKVLGDITVYVGEHLTDAAFTLLLEQMYRSLRMKPHTKPSGETRRFVLVGEGGRVLREADVERIPAARDRSGG